MQPIINSSLSSRAHIILSRECRRRQGYYVLSGPVRSGPIYNLIYSKRRFLDIVFFSSYVWFQLFLKTTNLSFFSCFPFFSAEKQQNVALTRVCVRFAITFWITCQWRWRGKMKEREGSSLSIDPGETRCYTTFNNYQWPPFCVSLCKHLKQEHGGYMSDSGREWRLS